MYLMNQRRPLRCPECLKTNQRSVVRAVGSERIPAAGFAPVDVFYDEAGLWHGHDLNRICTKYGCSNSHVFSITWGNQCPACKWTPEPLEEGSA